MWLLLLFVVVPAVELMLILEVGSRIGALATLLVIVLTGIAGVTLARVEGLAVLTRIRQATAEGRMPADEVVEGVLILMAAAMLLTPGFLTDAFGFLVLIPFTRPLFRRLAMRWIRVRIEHHHPGPPFGP